MKFKKFFIFSVFLLTLISALNILAFRNFWYWRWRWFDEPMHFLGGLLAGLVAIQIFLYWKQRRNSSITGWDIGLISLIAALAVGSFWELLEFTADQAHIARVELKTLMMVGEGWRGSLKDLIFDLIGSMVAAILFLFSLLCPKKKAQ